MKYQQKELKYSPIYYNDESKKNITWIEKSEKIQWHYRMLKANNTLLTYISELINS
jgi:hypothetical protein